jgi:general secretion pathway protein D
LGGRRWGGLAAVLLAIAPAALGQREPVPEAAPPAVQEEAAPSRGRWRLFEPEVELTLLVAMCSSGLGLHVEYDRSKLEGRVALDRPGEFTAVELWRVLNRELAARGLASVQPPGHTGIRIVPVAEAANQARVEAPDLAGAVAGFVKLVVGLDHRQGDELVEPIKLLLSKSGAVTAIREANALLVSDYTPYVEQVLAALSILDVPTSVPAAVEVPLEHVAPLSMATLIERVTATRKGIGAPLAGTAIALPESQSMLVVAPASEVPWWRRTIGEFDRPEPITTLHYVPRRFGLTETARLIEATVRGPTTAEPPGSWRMVEDSLTGTLILSTTPKRHAAVQQLLTRLEETEQGPRKPLRAFQIKNRRVSEVLDLLQGLLEAGVLDDPAKAAETKAPEPGIQGATAPITRAPPRPPAKADDVTLAADEATNRILAFGEVRVLDELEHLIDQIDVREAQVLIEALVVSLTANQTRSLGIELQKVGSSGGQLYRLASLFGLGSPDPGSSTVILPVQAQGGTAVVLDPGDFSAIVRALETLNQGRTLTIPKVLVNNNVQANLDSTLQTPFASTNASTTVATTSFGGTLDAGTSIAVKPQVADGDQIVMEYTVSLSSFVGEASIPELPPPRQENKLQSVVTIPDGFTVVVGGLEVETESDGGSQVPWIAEVPLLGELFKNRSTTHNRSRFFVFLRCTVMRAQGFEDLKYYSRRDLDVAGLDDGWPELEPRVIR